MDLAGMLAQVPLGGLEVVRIAYRIEYIYDAAQT